MRNLEKYLGKTAKSGASSGENAKQWRGAANTPIRLTTVFYKVNRHMRSNIRTQREVTEFFVHRESVNTAVLYSYLLITEIFAAGLRGRKGFI